jgi:ABC-type lipoprotein release transport system permease subunit
VSAVVLLVRRSLRSHRRGILGLALVVALAGGVALTSLSGARRTASSFERYRDDSLASDVALNIVGRDETGEESSSAPSARIREAASQLPQVTSTASYVGLESVGILDDDGELLPYQPEVIGSIDGRFLRQDRVALTEGRLPDADAQDEIFLNERMASHLGAHVGSRVHVAVAPLSALTEEDPSKIVVLANVDALVVGIGQFPDEVLGDDFDGSDRLLVTPAFTQRWQDVAGTYVWQGLRLAPGSDVDRTIVDYERLLPADLQVNVQRGDVQVARVQRAVRPVVVSLAVFGAAAALAALALGALGTVRLVSAARGDVRILRTLGLGPFATTGVVGVGAMVAAALGALGAAGLAWALSPLTPVGPVRQVEPARGFDLDATVLLLGGGLLLVLLLGTAVLAARQSVAAERSGADAASRPSRLAATCARLGLGPSAVIGARHAMGDGRRGGPPARSTLVACTLAVTAIAAALTFGASVRSLLRTPERYGWPADVAIQAGGGYDEIHLESAPGVAHLDGVEGLTVAAYGSLVVDGQRVNALGILPVEGAPAISIVHGRAPRQAGEVALGAATARHLGVRLGDRLQGEGGALRVTGIVALPAIGPLASVHPSLGQGALLTADGLTRQDEAAYPSLAFVRLSDGVDPEGNGRALLGRAYARLAGFPEGGPADEAEVFDVQRPSEVIGLQPATRTANLLAGLLAGAAILALVLSLSASVRRRSATYAILSSIGFARGDLRSTVRWHTNVVTTLALVVGLPIGVALGRVAWTAFADDLGAAGGPRVPLLVLLAAAAGLLLLANAIGEWPARAAARRPLEAWAADQRAGGSTGA